MKMNMFNDIIYLVIEREFIKTNEHIYKIGTTQNSITKRLNGYPKGTHLLYCRVCPNGKDMELSLKNSFKDRFIHRLDIGSEYFEGKCEEMINVINEEINKNHIKNINNDENVNLYKNINFDKNNKISDIIKKSNNNLLYFKNNEQDNLDTYFYKLQKEIESENIYSFLNNYNHKEINHNVDYKIYRLELFISIKLIMILNFKSLTDCEFKFFDIDKILLFINEHKNILYNLYNCDDFINKIIKMNYDDFIISSSIKQYNTTLKEKEELKQRLEILREQIGNFKINQFDKNTKSAIDNKLKRITKKNQELNDITPQGRNRRSDVTIRLSNEFKELETNLEKYTIERNELRTKTIKLIEERDIITERLKVINNQELKEIKQNLNNEPYNTENLDFVIKFINKILFKLFYIEIKYDKKNNIIFINLIK